MGYRFHKRSRTSAWGVVTLILGLGLVIPSFILFTVALANILAGSSPAALSSMLVTAASLGVPGLASLIFSRVLQTNKSKYVRYQTAVGDKKVVPIRSLVSVMRRSLSATERDLQHMVDYGWFGGNAYLDLSKGAEMLVVDPAAKGLDLYAKLIKKLDETEKKAKKQDNAPAAAEVNTESSSADDYQKLTEQIHVLGGQISDAQVGAQVGRIETVTANIFSSVRENPDKLPMIRMFMDFYLPTTLKLLGAYTRLEKIDADTENIASAKANIEKIIGVIVTGFEQQLDRLYETEEMDISSEIDVLEQMLYRDGFTTDTVYDIGAQADTAQADTLNSYSDEIDDYIDELTGGTAAMSLKNDDTKRS